MGLTSSKEVAAEEDATPSNEEYGRQLKVESNARHGKQIPRVAQSSLTPLAMFGIAMMIFAIVIAAGFLVIYLWRTNSVYGSVFAPGNNCSIVTCDAGPEGQRGPSGASGPPGPSGETGN